MDQDEGIDDDIIYSIASGNTRINGTPSFFINETTGWITVSVPLLDREEEEEYILTIMVPNISHILFVHYVSFILGH